MNSQHAANCRVDVALNVDFESFDGAKTVQDAGRLAEYTLLALHWRRAFSDFGI